MITAPRAAMFLTGPAVVQEVLGERVTATDLGGPAVHAANGVAHFEATSEVEAILLARDLLEHLPQEPGGAVPRRGAARAGGDDPSATVPSDPRKVYDVRAVVSAIADGGRLLEVSPRWAPNVVCAFTRIEGRPSGSWPISRRGSPAC